jgi:hypothetical protein
MESEARGFSSNLLLEDFLKAQSSGIRDSSSNGGSNSEEYEFPSEDSSSFEASEDHKKNSGGDGSGVAANALLMMKKSLSAASSKSLLNKILPKFGVLPKSGPLYDMINQSTRSNLHQCDFSLV